MNKQNQIFDDPGIDGPDYVALVIEWDELADQLEDEITTERITLPQQQLSPIGVVTTALGALGVLGLAVWGIRRLRAA